MAMSAAMMSPAGPLPTTATRQPVFGARGGSVTWSVSRSKSAANRSSAPTASGSPLLPSRHSFSHWSSCGQTRPQTAGSAFFSRISRAAPAKSPAATSLTNPGMSTPTGQPSTHAGFLHCRQRLASATASSLS